MMRWVARRHEGFAAEASTRQVLGSIRRENPPNPYATPLARSRQGRWPSRWAAPCT